MFEIGPSLGRGSWRGLFSTRERKRQRRARALLTSSSHPPVLNSLAPFLPFRGWGRGCSPAGTSSRTSSPTAGRSRPLLIANATAKAEAECSHGRATTAGAKLFVRSQVPPFARETAESFHVIRGLVVSCVPTCTHMWAGSRLSAVARPRPPAPQLPLRNGRGRAASWIRCYF